MASPPIRSMHFSSASRLIQTSGRNKMAKISIDVGKFGTFLTKDEKGVHLSFVAQYPDLNDIRVVHLDDSGTDKTSSLTLNFSDGALALSAVKESITKFEEMEAPPRVTIKCICVLERNLKSPNPDERFIF